MQIDNQLCFAIQSLSDQINYLKINEIDANESQILVWAWKTNLFGKFLNIIRVFNLIRQDRVQ